MNWKNSYLVVGSIVLFGSSTLSLKAAVLQFDKISKVGDYIKTTESNEHIKPEQILLILDVDGTLTSEGTPEEGETAKPRGNAVSLMKAFKAEGINLVASSAWDDFKSVLVRINDIGLSDTFGVDAKHGQIVNKKEKFPSNEDKLSVDIHWFGIGNVVSVQDPKVDDEFFRQKALAPYLIPALAEKLKKQEIKHVVFVDDSEGNIEIFHQDVERFKLYDKIPVDSIELGEAIHDPATR